MLEKPADKTGTFRRPRGKLAQRRHYEGHLAVQPKCDVKTIASKSGADSPIAEVVLVTCNSSPYIESCLKSIPLDVVRVIVVDNGSTDGTQDIVKRFFPTVELIENGANLSYGPSFNVAFPRTQTQYIVLSNADVVYSQGAIQTLVDFLIAHADVGVTAPQFLYPDGAWQISYGDIPSIWTGLRDATGVNSIRRWVRRLFWRIVDRKPKDVPYVSGAVLVFRRRAVEAVGGFDEAFFFYCDESDLCIRLRQAGWRVVFCPLARVTHVAGGDSIKVDRSEKFLTHLVNSQCRLAKKYLSDGQARFYMRCQRIYFSLLALGSRAIELLAIGSTACRFSYKAWSAGTYARLWKEKISEVRSG